MTGSFSRFTLVWRYRRIVGRIEDNIVVTLAGMDRLATADPQVPFHDCVVTLTGTDAQSSAHRNRRFNRRSGWVGFAGEVGFNRVWASGAAAGALGGQIFVLVAIVVAAGQLALGLALVAALVRKRPSLDIEDLGRLKW